MTGATYAIYTARNRPCGADSGRARSAAGRAERRRLREADHGADDPTGPVGGDRPGHEVYWLWTSSPIPCWRRPWTASY
jgi:hypothetical protein